MNIMGDIEYGYTPKGNPPTDKQRWIITMIDQYLHKKFKGSTSHEAYAFIQKYHYDIKFEKGEVYLRNKRTNKWYKAS